MLSANESGHTAWVVAAMAVVLGVAGYVLAWQQHEIAQSEAMKRIASDETKTKELAARIAAERRAEVAENQVREVTLRLEQIGKQSSAQTRTESGATNPVLRPASGAASGQRTLVSDEVERRDAKELAQLQVLRSRCQGIINAEPGPFRDLMAAQYCNEYNQRLQERRNYEAMRRGQTPVQVDSDCNPRVRRCN